VEVFSLAVTEPSAIASETEGPAELLGRELAFPFQCIYDRSHGYLRASPGLRNAHQHDISHHVRGGRFLTGDLLLRRPLQY